jgi:hypothetical protein
MSRLKQRKKRTDSVEAYAVCACIESSCSCGCYCICSCTSPELTDGVYNNGSFYRGMTMLVDPYENQDMSQSIQLS